MTSHANQLLPFAIGAGSNVESPELWAADTVRLTGFEAGLASSQKMNTALRQASFVSGMIAQFTADYGPSDVNDDGNLAVFENQFLAALGTALLSEIPAGLLFEGADSGTANAMAVSSFVPTLSALAAGKVFLIKKSAAANTGAVTLTVAAVTAPVQWSDGSALTRGQWPANAEGMVFYTGSVFQLLSFPGPGAFTGIIHTGTDTSGVANAIVCNVDPPIAAYNQGASYNILMANACTGAATCNFNSLGARSLTRQDGSALQAGDYVADEELCIVDQGTHLQLAALGRAEVQRLVLNPVLYVRTDGNDSNDGSANNSSHAFLTIAAAINAGVTKFSIAGTSLTIQLGNAGTYAAPGTIAGSVGTLVIRGDPLSQASYIISGSSFPGGGTLIFQNGIYQLNGVTIQNTGASNHTVAAAQGSAVTVNNVTVTCTNTNTSFSHFFATGGGSITLGTSGGVIAANNMGSLLSVSGGTINTNPNVVTITGTPSYAIATAAGNGSGGQINLISGLSFSGSATGKRYDVQLNAVINSFGGGTTFLPGNASGTTATGGQYA